MSFLRVSRGGASCDIYDLVDSQPDDKDDILSISRR